MTLQPYDNFGILCGPLLAISVGRPLLAIKYFVFLQINSISDSSVYLCVYFLLVDYWRYFFYVSTSILFTWPVHFSVYILIMIPNPGHQTYSSCKLTNVIDTQGPRVQTRLKFMDFLRIRSIGHKSSGRTLICRSRVWQFLGSLNNLKPEKIEPIDLWAKFNPPYSRLRIPSFLLRWFYRRLTYHLSLCLYEGNKCNSVQLLK